VTYSTSPAWGLGLATITADDTVLDAWYATGALGLGEPPAGASPATRLTGDRALPGLRTVAVVTLIGSLADVPKDACDAYLRLHLL
jgi:2,3,4,5-tetrahydropyridine-2-carboxylate N-succinyltransferase